MRWSTACIDWADRLRRRQSIIPPPIFASEAERALAIFKQLRVVDLPGKPTFGECADEWVFDFVRAIFGANDPDTGRQLIREFFMLISKKNTKSTIAAGIMVTATLLCWREDEEHLILAPTKEIADNSFKPAAGMVRADEELMTLFHIQDHLRTITHRVTRASLKVVAADTDTVGGKKAGRVMIDELWIFGKKSNADAMLLEALGGQVNREEGFTIYLTTQSDEPPAGVFKDRLDYFRDVRDGKVVDPKSLPIIYEYTEAMVKAKAYLDPQTHYIPNPNLGRSVSPEWLQDQIAKKRDKTDGTFQNLLAKHFNVQIGLNLRAGRWAGADHWQACAAPDIVGGLEELIDRCEVLDVGIDGGGLEDLLGLCVAGRERGTHRWLVWFRAWAHTSVLERYKAESPRLMDFVADGDLIVVDAIGEDVRGVAEVCEQCLDSGALDRVGVDPAGLGGIIEALNAVQIGGDKIIGISQGWRLNGAIKTAERKLAGGELLHSGSALMLWCVGNAKTVPVGNAVTINKQSSGAGKIDPLMAMFNAVSLLSLNPQAANTRSFWEAEAAAEAAA